MNRICDLHTHSVFSDGTSTPAQIIDEAVRMGLSAVALCDHNTVDGLPDFLSATVGQPIDAIPGAEFSVDLDGTELHLLGLFIEPAYFSQVSDLMREVRLRKERSNIALADALNRAGYRFDYTAIRSRSPMGTINRAHIAAELTRLGYTGSVREAFASLLSPEAGYYVEPERLTVWEMIDFIRSIHAVPVLAHPFLNLPEARLAEFLPQAKNRGLIGMETAYPLYSEETTALAAALAGRYGLLRSGGSDFHGDIKPDIRLGVGTGTLRVPGCWADTLRAARPL